MMKILLGLFIAALAYAAVTCAGHPWAVCNYAGVGPSGASKYHCSCGDDVYVK